MYVREGWSQQMSLSPGWLTDRVTSDKVQLRSPIPILILLLYLLVSIDLVCTGIREA